MQRTEPKAKQKFFSVTLSLPVPQSSQQKSTANLQSKQDPSTIKGNWKSVCQKWGMNIVRELVYVQNSILEENKDGSTEKHESHRSQVNELSSSTIIVDGCEAFKVKDRLMVTALLDQRSGKVISDNDEEDDNEHTQCGIIGTDDCDKMKDMSSSVAKRAGIKPGDIIHAVYGMKNPKLELLFGILRDSITFQ